MKRIYLPFAALMLLVLAGCLPRQQLLPALGLNVPVQRDFPADFKVPVSSETGQLVTGFGGGGGGVHHTPIIFVHGNTVAPRFWNTARAWLLAHGYTKDEVWAVGYGHDCTCHFDSNDAAVPTIGAFVASVQNYLREHDGQPVAQVNIIAHSLGVTLVRQWMEQDNAWYRVRNFIGVAGANHGTWVSPPDAHGISRAAPLELYVGSPWLAQLNRGGETPGDTRYLMLYDGTGWYDVFYAPWQKNSPALAGATNVPYDVQHPWAGYGHLELPSEPATLRLMLDFIDAGGEPLPTMPPPRILRKGHLLTADQSGARIRCTTDGTYPSARTAAVSQVPMRADTLYTCYAENPRSSLSSPMARYQYTAGARSTSPLMLTASPAGGLFEYPQKIELAANEPHAFITYTTSGAPPTSGSPLYRGPIYIVSSVTLRAVAYAADGRRSKPITLHYVVSPEAVDQVNSLQRQLDPSLPASSPRVRRGNPWF